MRINLRGEEFELLPERCLFWPSQRLLIVADCHFGKAETFQQRGLWLPSTSMRRDLATLSLLVKRWAVESIVFLGDLVHSLAGVTNEIVQDFGTWLRSFPGQIHVVVGNHDSGLSNHWPAAWDCVERCKQVHVSDFVFQHQPPHKAVSNPSFLWVGHIHPMIALGRGPDRIRLPAFVISQTQGVLPAFSSLAGGFNMTPSEQDRVFVIGEHVVYEI